MSATFAENITSYYGVGWRCVMPVPPHAKHPPPEGFTGAGGVDTTPEQLVEWAEAKPDASIALRLPDGVIAIDVDHYTKGAVTKSGSDDLDAAQARVGALPATWTCTARGDDTGPGQSRTLFYRVPPGRYRTKLSDSIEIIQRHHRYTVVAPSHHADAGQPYRWYDPDGALAERVPGPDDLAELPSEWVAELRAGATTPGHEASDAPSARRLLSEILADVRTGPLGYTACADMEEALAVALREMRESTEGGRHDTAAERTHRIIHLAASGHLGGADALEHVKDLWDELTAGENRDSEFERLLIGSASKAVTKLGGRTTPVESDPCAFADMMAPVPAPVDDRPDEEGPVDAPDEPVISSVAQRAYSVAAFVGTHPFDPQAEADQLLAEDALERLFPAVRYAYDTDTWLLRGPDKWEPRSDLTTWAPTYLSRLMPRGDPDAPKDDPEHRTAKRRQRFLDNASANKVSGRMRAVVSGGLHPASITLAELDQSPFMVWAAGAPYDIRRSRSEPTLARLDPNTPHLHSASIAPAAVATPKFDAFLEAVFPDPELRAWALRVLSVAVTGYPSAVLPILQGETRRGKSALVALLMSVLGTYAHAADPRLLASADNAHASIKYALKGRRLSFIDEGPREGRWAQEQLKQLTGGTPLTGNAMRKDPVTFEPTHTLTLTTNEIPTLTDPALRARVRLLPCNGDPEAVRETRRAIGDVGGVSWQAEAPGILAQLLSEAAAWLEEPDSAETSAAPGHIRFLAEEVAAEQDPIRDWVETECEPSPEGTKAGELYQAFRSYAWRMGVPSGRIPSTQAWGRALTALGYDRENRRDTKYRPLRLRGPGGMMPTPPSPAPAPAAPEPVPDVVSDCARYSPTSGTPENPRSDGGFEGVVSDVSDMFRPINHNHKNPINDLGSPGASIIPGEWDPYRKWAQLIFISRSDQGKQGSTISGTAEQSGHTPPANTESSEKAHSAALRDSLLGAKQSEPAPAPTNGTGKGKARLSDEEKARRAAERKEKAAEKKAAERQAKIAAAEGRTLTLPVAVTRDGDCLEVTLDQARQLMPPAESALTVDIENTGYPSGHIHHKLRTVQLGAANVAVVLDPHAPEQAAFIAETIAAYRVLHAHSATADLVPLGELGLIDVEAAWQAMHDTVIPAKLADPHSTGSDPSLKALSDVVLGDEAVSPRATAERKALFKAGGWLENVKELDTPVERSGWAQVNSACETMLRYAACDVLDTALLALRVPQPEPALLERERAVQRVTARLTHAGLPIDTGQVQRLAQEHTRLRDEAAANVYPFGIDNPGADQQVAGKFAELGVVLPRTEPSKTYPQGQPSVAGDVLTDLAERTDSAGELAKWVGEHREHQQRLSLFLKPYSDRITYGDSRMRSTIYTLGTGTGRMSSVRLNLQQQPKVGGFRAMLTTDPGQCFISADLSSVEIRVMAALSQDPELMRLLAEGADVHAMIAQEVFGADWTKADRYKIKAGVFGWSYGGGIETLAKQVGVSQSIMASAIDVLAAIAPGYVGWKQNLQKAVRSGATAFPAYSGRTIHIPGQDSYKAANYAVQGTGRELLVDALLKWDDGPYGGGVVLPVHDEIVAVVEESVAEAATQYLVECFTTQLYGVDIFAEASEPSKSWADAT